MGSYAPPCRGDNVYIKLFNERDLCLPQVIYYHLLISAWVHEYFMLWVTAYTVSSFDYWDHFCLASVSFWHIPTNVFCIGFDFLVVCLFLVLPYNLALQAQDSLSSCYHFCKYCLHLLENRYYLCSFKSFFLPDSLFKLYLWK